MKESMKYLCAILILLLMLPFLLTVLISGKGAVSVSKEIDPEMLLPVRLYQDIPENAEMELIKAQAILERSYLAQELSEGQEARAVLEKNREFEESHTIYPDIMEQCRRAVADTEGMVLAYGGTVVAGPFFACGNGITRDGIEVMGKDTYGWLVSVDSSEDLNSPRYLSGCLFDREGLYQILRENTGDTSLSPASVFEQITILLSDSAGYVTELQVGDTHISGENFRKMLGLPSACFSMQEMDDKLRFLCKGAGHGLGMSQYGANCMAQEGKSYKEILNYYFPRCSVEESSL